jgi:hemolysin III
LFARVWLQTPGYTLPYRQYVAAEFGGVVERSFIDPRRNVIIGDAEALSPGSPRSLVAPYAEDDDLPQVFADAVTRFLVVPRARGWIHGCSAAVFIVIGAALVPAAWVTTSPKAGWATLVYSATIVAMFSVSAVYHLVQWRSAIAERWMKRADHSLIFAFIAGSYTPFALVALPPPVGLRLLTIVYVGAAGGIALKMLWPSAPRTVGVPLYLVLGWVAIWFAPILVHCAGVRAVLLLVAGAVLYNIGAVLYALRWPNPWPQVFGYHEFFHAFTAAAAICHYIAICIVVVKG